MRCGTWRMLGLVLLLALVGARSPRLGTEGSWRLDEQWKSDRNVSIDWKDDWAKTYTFNKEQWRKELTGKDREDHLRFRLIALLEAEMARWPELAQKQAEACNEIADHLRSLGYVQAGNEYARRAVALAVGHVNLTTDALNGMLRGADSWPVEPIEWGAKRIIALHHLGQIGETDWRLLQAYEALAEVERRQGKFMEAARTLAAYQLTGAGRRDFHDYEEASLYAAAGHVEEAIGRWQAILAQREDQRLRERVAQLSEAQMLSAGRFSGSETTTLKWSVMRLRPGADPGRDLLELGQEDPGAVVPWDQSRFTSLWSGMERMIKEGDKALAEEIRAGEKLSGVDMAAYRRAAWSDAAQVLMLRMGEQELRAGRFGLAGRDFEDVLRHSSDQGLQEQARRGLALARGSARLQQGNVGAPAWQSVGELAVPAGEAWPGELLQGIPDEMTTAVGDIRASIISGEGRTIVGVPGWLACYGEDLTRPVWVQRPRSPGGMQGEIRRSKAAYVTLPGQFEPVIEHGRVYTRWGLDASGALLTTVAAFELKSGRMIWTSAQGSARDVWPVGDPAVAEGRIYYFGVGQETTASGSPSYLVCLDANDGRVIYKRRVGDFTLALTLHGDRERERETPLSVDLAHYGNAVTVEAGAVYVCTNMGIVARFDARDGLLEWARMYTRARMTVDSWPIFTRRGSAPVVSGDKVVFLPRDHYGAFALDAASGDVAWDQPFLVSQEVIGAVSGVVVVKDRFHLMGIDAATGSIRWNREESFRGARLEGKAIAADAGDRLIVLDGLLGVIRGQIPRDGKEPMRGFGVRGTQVLAMTDRAVAPEQPQPPSAAGAGTWTLAAPQPQIFVPPEQSPLKGKVLVGSPGAVYCIETASGNNMWQRHARPALIKIEFSANAVMLVQPFGVECIDGETGALRWETHTPFAVDESVVVGNAIVVADRDRWRGASFAAIDVNTGQILWQRGSSSGGERIGELAQMIPDADLVHVIARSGRYGELADIVCRAADGAILGTHDLLNGRSMPKFLEIDGLDGCGIAENKVLTWFTLDREAKDPIVAKAELLRLYPGEPEALLSAGKWTYVRMNHRKMGRLSLILCRDDPSYLLEREHPGVLRGDRFYEIADRVITVVDLPSKKELGRYVIPVPSDIDHHTQILDFREEQGMFRVVSGMERGFKPDERRPTTLRLDTFDLRTGNHRMGRELSQARFWRAWAPERDRDGREKDQVQVLRQSQALDSGGMLVVSSLDGIHGVNESTPPPVLQQTRICYREGEQPPGAWAINGLVEGRMAVSHDDEHLYVSVVYPDALIRPMIGSGQQIAGDWLEMALTGNAGRFRFGVGANEHGRAVFENLGNAPLPDGISASIRHDLARLEHFYRVSIPLRSIAYRDAGDAWRHLGISLCAWDDQGGGLPKRMVTFGHGIEQGQTWEARQAPIYLHALSPEQESAAMAIVDQLPELPAAQAFFRKQCLARQDSPDEAVAFAGAYLRRHPDGVLAGQAMAFVDQVLRTGPGDDPAARVLRMAQDAGVSQEARNRYAASAGATLSQWVWIDPAAPPRMLLLQLHDGKGWEHRVSWGEDLAPWTGVPGTPSRRVIGDLPEAGKWVKLRIPLIWLDMHDKPICGISFGQIGGRNVCWNRTSLIVNGRESVLIDDQTPEGTVGGFWEWTSEQRKSGEKSHTYIAPVAPDEAAWHDISALKHPITAHLAGAVQKETSAGSARALGILETQVPRLGLTDAAIDFFQAMLDLESGPQAVAQRYSWFFKTLPLHPRLPELLNDLRLELSRAGAVDPEKQVDAIMEQLKLPLRARYSYRRTYLYPQRNFVRNWLVIGSFPNADDRGLETPYPPETDRLRPDAEYAGATQALKWKALASPRDYIDLLSACSPGDQAVGYAACWVYSEKARTAAIELGSDDGSKVWINRKLVHSVHRHDHALRGEWRVGIFLTAGWNEVLVKVEQHGGDWGFYFELVDPEGRGELQGARISAAPPGR